VQKLEEVGIPQDSLIFYQNNRWVYQAGQVRFDNNQISYQSIDSLGPFGKHLNNIFQILIIHFCVDICSVDVTFILFPSSSEYTITKIGNRQLNDTEKATGVYAPIAEITLEGFARSIANIPETATHFCWLYPSDSILKDDNIDFDNSHESNLLKIGGFAYFIVDKNNGDTLQLVRVNSLIESAENGLTFEGPYPWRKEFTDQLWNQKRFQVSFLFFCRILIHNNDIDYLACNFTVSSCKRCTILCLYQSI
jgi:hypothetical protein